MSGIPVYVYTTIQTRLKWKVYLFIIKRFTITEELQCSGRTEHNVSLSQIWFLKSQHPCLKRTMRTLIYLYCSWALLLIQLYRNVMCYPLVARQVAAVLWMINAWQKVEFVVCLHWNSRHTTIPPKKLEIDSSSATDSFCMFEMLTWQWHSL